MSLPDYTYDNDCALQLDEKDDLHHFRNKFYFSGKDQIYLDGNSLGRLPLATQDLLQNNIIAKWGNELINSWNQEWYELPETISRKIASIVGAGEGEIATCDSTSINLYKLAQAALNRQKGRTQIVSDELNFPTDLYVLQSIISRSGNNHKLVKAPSNDGDNQVRTEELSGLINENTAIVMLSHVAFKSAFMYDMQKINEIAHRNGALVIWDLSHAAGAVPLQLSASDADLAVGCTYKYLNGGPGSPAFLYVNKKLQNELVSPVWGWFGEHQPFDFNPQYRPAHGIRKFMVGTPPILSLAAVEPGLNLILEAGINNLRVKSVSQTEYLIFLAKRFLLPLGFKFGSPLYPKARGSHVSLQHPESYRICRALIHPIDEHPAVIPDFRAPDNIRFGITPLYTTFSEIYTAVRRVEEIVKIHLYEKYSDKRDAVT